MHYPFGVKNFELKYCQMCRKLKTGECQAICVHCGYADGSDKWFSREGEAPRILLWD